MADNAGERDRYCRLAAMAGHRDACRMSCFSHPDLFEDHLPLTPFKSRGIRMAFYGHYYPSRYHELLSEEQRAFCRSLYLFKNGEAHGIEFFKACMSALQTDEKPYHIMFMPCSNWIKYGQRFKRLDWYISKHRRELTSGLHDVDVFDERESLHEAQSGGERILERNYRITRDIKGKRGHHRGRCADDRAERGRLQGGDRTVRRQGGGGHLLRKDRYRAAVVPRYTN